MLPFCGYNMGDYFGHWLKMQSAIKRPPRIFMVNWFRKDSNGKFLWPGFGDNLRVLTWMLDRIHGRSGAHPSPVGRVPYPDDLDLRGLDLSPDKIRADLAVNSDEWKAEMNGAGEFFERFGNHLPADLRARHRALIASLNHGNGAKH
jgi:phosphoenolpyruvate carboxykinase (GTP)